MGAYTAFEASSQTIQKLLQQRIDADADLAGVTIFLKTPKEETQRAIGDEPVSVGACPNWPNQWPYSIND